MLLEEEERKPSSGGADTDTCVLLRLRGPIGLRVLDLRASGGGGGTRLEEVESRLSADGKSRDLRREAKSFSIEVESWLDSPLGGGVGRGLVTSEDLLSTVGLRGDVTGFDIEVGKLCTLGDEIVGAKSENETTCGPFGATAFPCRCRGGGGLTLTLFLRSSMLD
jgi:hypothetical protein